MEDKIKKLKGVSKVSINFFTKTLIMEIDEIKRVEELIAATKEIVVSVEPYVVVKEKKAFKSFIQSSEAKPESSSEYMKNVEMEVQNSKSVEKAEDKEVYGSRKKLTRFGAGAVLFAVAASFKFSLPVEFALYFVSYILVGGEVVLRAVKNIARGQVFDENFLMSIATIGAFAIGEFPEGVAVMLFYQVGEFFQDLAVNRSRKSIAELMDIRPDYANLKEGDSERKVSPEEVEIGSVIIVKPGEKVPLDGRVIEGNSMLDTSALTGESLPREVFVGDDILSGAINKNGLLAIEVTKPFGESTVAKILELVQNAGSKKAPTENFITKFARYYTPVVVAAAAVLAFLPPLLIEGASFSEWVRRALVFLVVSCPCALVVSIPLGFFGGIGGASKNGVLVKGGNYLEALNNVEIAVFDKTGTLTKGVFKVTKIKPTMNYNEKLLLEYAAKAECYSNHPIGVSILKAYGVPVNKEMIEEYNEIPGHGVSVVTEGRNVLAGNSKLMESEGIAYSETESAGTVIHVAVDGDYAGYIVISDEIKEDSVKAVKALRAAGVKRIVMLTGDNRAVAERVGREVGVDEVYSELLPGQKVEKVEELENQKSAKGKLVFVGDGINDAPVLARADIGIAMGGVGSDAAIEAADVVIMTDEPYKLVTAIKVAKKTKSIVIQNIIFALGVKGIILVLGAFGMASMWEAVFGDVGVALIAVLNAMRAMKVDNI
jgi:Zn2+/Cd2+-exporting ATPase